MDDLIPVEEAARMVSHDIESLIRRRKITPHKLGNKRYILMGDIERVREMEAWEDEILETHMRIEQLARMSGCERGIIYELWKAGELHPIKIGGINFYPPESIQIVKDYLARPKNIKPEGDTLCWDCKNATGKCSWSKSLKPVKGWVAEKGGCSVAVRECPKFERG